MEVIMDLKLFALIKGKISSAINSAISTRPCPIAAESLPYAPSVTVVPNTETTVGMLEGTLEITLGTAVSGLANEWDFVIKQGSNAYTVVLPTVRWGLGFAPSFAENTSTMCRLYYLGGTLCGEWVSI